MFNFLGYAIFVTITISPVGAMTTTAHTFRLPTGVCQAARSSWRYTNLQAREGVLLQRVYCEPNKGENDEENQD
jgi:hypothetical protein